MRDQGGRLGVVENSPRHRAGRNCPQRDKLSKNLCGKDGAGFQPRRQRPAAVTKPVPLPEMQAHAGYGPCSRMAIKRAIRQSTSKPLAASRQKQLVAPAEARLQQDAKTTSGETWRWYCAISKSLKSVLFNIVRQGELQRGFRSPGQRHSRG